MLISLYTSRMILASLGFTDHGIYNLVASVVVMFNMFSATFVSATQRFLNVEMGKGDKKRTQNVFSASINIHIFLSIVILFLMESIGLWFLNTKLNIPADRCFAANIVYQLSILSFIINIISIPYNAVIIANERMDVFAYVSIFEVISKLLVVFLLPLIIFDRLIVYGFLLFVISLLVRLFYGYFCGKNFDECKYVNFKDRGLYIEMLSISGWNFLGSSASILTVSGMGIILNVFTNVIVNSAKGISSQVENVVKQFVDNFMMSIRPQITKSYAQGNVAYLNSLLSRGTRFSFILMSFFCFPLIFHAEYVLRLWLGNIPQYTTELVQLSLVYIMVIPFSNILDTLLLASGKIKNSQMVLSLLQLCTLPFSCIILYIGCEPYYIYIAYILISYISLIARIVFSIKYANLKLSFYINHICARIMVFTIVSISFLLLLMKTFPISNVFDIVCRCCMVCLVVLICAWLLCLNLKERLFIVSKVKKYIYNGQNR